MATIDPPSLSFALERQAQAPARKWKVSWSPKCATREKATHARRRPKLAPTLEEVELHSSSNNQFSVDTRADTIHSKFSISEVGTQVEPIIKCIGKGSKRGKKAVKKRKDRRGPLGPCLEENEVNSNGAQAYDIQS